jgi:hypothetical protein
MQSFKVILIIQEFVIQLAWNITQAFLICIECSVKISTFYTE